MAVLQRINQASADRHDQMTERLYQEWHAPQPGEGEPFIIEESPRLGGWPNHLYVIWSEWSDLSPLERSRMILQAYRQHHGLERTMIVTLAMGLTPDEARLMKIEF